MKASELFPGPRAFKTEERDLFFGRDREARQLHDLALSCRVLLLYSRSGAGKSSLINSKLVPFLEASGSTPLIARVGGTLPADSELLAADSFNIHVFNLLTSLRRPDAVAARPVAAPTPTLVERLSQGRMGELPYLIIDQAEELFTAYPERWSDRKAFFQQLQEALQAQSSLHVLFAIREEHVAALDPFAGFVPGGFRFRYRLERLDVAAAEQAIRQPLKKMTIEVEDAALGELITDLRREHLPPSHGQSREIVGEYVEPLHLQVVCRSLLAMLPEGTTTITKSDVTRYARVDLALQAYYNAAIRSTVEYHGRTAAAVAKIAAAARRGPFEARLRGWIEDSLISGIGTRGFALLADAKDAGVPESCVTHLAGERVVNIDERAGARWVELTHDRFISSIREANARWRAPRRTTVQAVGLLLVVGVVLGAQYWTERREHDRIRQEAARQSTLEAQKQIASVEKQRDENEEIARFAASEYNLRDRRTADAQLSNDAPIPECTDVTVSYYTPSAPPEYIEQLVQTWRNLGFKVLPITFGIPQQMNAIWQGRDVEASCLRAVALTLIRAGIPVRAIGRPLKGVEEKAQRIEIGYSGPARLQPPRTVDDIAAIK